MATSSIAFAQTTKNEKGIVRRIGCEIVGSIPIEGGDNCYLFNRIAVINRCNQPPCKLPLSMIKENRYFRCPNQEAPTPGWVEQKEAETAITNFYLKEISGRPFELDTIKNWNGDIQPFVFTAFTGADIEKAKATLKRSDKALIRTNENLVARFVDKHYGKIIDLKANASTEEIPSWKALSDCKF